MDDIRTSVAVNFPAHFTATTKTVVTPGGNFLLMQFTDPAISFFFREGGDRLVFVPAHAVEIKPVIAVIDGKRVGVPHAG